eukprot:TRINITY_DN946_c0_g1_i3.p1 TRINITY_DN946_c0_g1~~TRINITY_DN946_c0_g1_i3.p1  ORF type:complete len:785 (+),score=113.03 TRINITY_DN946_c0_g1_i3:453-2807(+)
MSKSTTIKLVDRSAERIVSGDYVYRRGLAQRVETENAVFTTSVQSENMFRVEVRVKGAEVDEIVEEPSATAAITKAYGLIYGSKARYAGPAYFCGVALTNRLKAEMQKASDLNQDESQLTDSQQLHYMPLCSVASMGVQAVPETSESLTQYARQRKMRPLPPASIDDDRSVTSPRSASSSPSRGERNSHSPDAVLRAVQTRLWTSSTSRGIDKTADAVLQMVGIEDADIPTAPRTADMHNLEVARLTIDRVRQHCQKDVQISLSTDGGSKSKRKVQAASVHFTAVPGDDLVNKCVWKPGKQPTEQGVRVPLRVPIGTKSLREGATADVIAKEIKVLLDQVNNTQPLIILQSDSEATITGQNAGMVVQLRELLKSSNQDVMHCPCAAHCLNNALKDALCGTFAEDPDRIKQTCVFIASLERLSQKCASFFRTHKLQDFNLDTCVEGCATRWGYYLIANHRILEATLVIAGQIFENAKDAQFAAAGLYKDDGEIPVYQVQSRLVDELLHKRFKALLTWVEMKESRRASEMAEHLISFAAHFSAELELPTIAPVTRAFAQRVNIPDEWVVTSARTLLRLFRDYYWDRMSACWIQGPLSLAALGSITFGRSQAEMIMARELESSGRDRTADPALFQLPVAEIRRFASTGVMSQQLYDACSRAFAHIPVTNVCEEEAVKMVKNILTNGSLSVSDEQLHARVLGRFAPFLAFPEGADLSEVRKNQRDIASLRTREKRQRKNDRVMESRLALALIDDNRVQTLIQRNAVLMQASVRKKRAAKVARVARSGE